MSDLLVTTANYAASVDQLKMLSESCKHYGIEFKHYGQDEPWRGFVKSKAMGLRKFLDTVTHEYVLFSDGWDSWMLAGEDAVFKRFARFEKRVVVAGHHFCYPHKKYKDVFPKAPTRFRYICSGQFMGETDRLKEVLDEVVNYGGWSDQGAWNRAYCDKRTSNLVDIDYHCELFLTPTLIPLDQLYFNKGRVFFKETGKSPINIHFGGPKGGSPNDVNMKTFYEEWLRNRV